MIVAGRSDKYGQVHVEKVGNTGFSDPDEPIALFRGQDRYAEQVMAYYYNMLCDDQDVTDEQLQSVARQLVAFSAFASANPDKMRTPGKTT
ncbi:MAG TPA: hypothetical protein VK611_30280 [Acidimicrobiales bacterium]|nr:hypothetical protein [Acidimicrobiales bacterium]